ncbi:helicase [Catenulispora subtropica]|uniref:Helicase domain protein n=1 Tax=Catenulispora subtropica TaxID=450798 RepID=A0ABP5ES25_9ACTN
MSDEQQVYARYVSWLDQQVMIGGRGDGLSTSDMDPSTVFWLGKLAPFAPAQDGVDRRGRMDPCAIGLRVRPSTPAPWSFIATIEACAWTRLDDGRWEKSDTISVPVPTTVEAGAAGLAVGADALERAFAGAGLPHLRAEIQVTDESWRDGEPELIIQLVNTSTPTSPKGQGYLFESSIAVSGLQTKPFVLEALPDSFRYDRRMPALGINCGVIRDDIGNLSTTDTIVVDRRRPQYAFGATSTDCLDLTFERLAAQPVATLTELVDAYAGWGNKHWSEDRLQQRATLEGWTAQMITDAAAAAGEHRDELDRLRHGVRTLKNEPLLMRAFALMNESMAHAGRGRVDRWRPFQIGFIVATLPGLLKDGAEWPTVETIWFATGGGKTEVYLGLLVLAVFYDRLRGKRAGITAWSRFPLRLLSLQQTQRFANALGAAELVRRKHAIGGDQIGLGYFVGRSSTPNEIPVFPNDQNEVNVEDPAMPAKYQVLIACPFCGSDRLRMKFDRAKWRLCHLCDAQDCPSSGEPLPVYVVDQEIYRFLPPVVIGTLDKAALIAMQGGMRAFVDGPAGECERPGHGFTYARRSKRPNGCLVPDCKAGVRLLTPKSRGDFAPSYRLQDELHLLRDSLGAVDSHYESLLDTLQSTLAGSSAKIIASSATLTGFERQAEVLYQRAGRVFPQPGPSAGESFWSEETEDLLRRFVAVWPRGVTLEWVSDRTTTIVQQSIRRLREDPAGICSEIGVDVSHAQRLIDLYGTNVVYGTTLRDVEAAQRSLGTQVPVSPLNSVQLTGGSLFEDVKTALERLTHPETNFDDRVHVVTASSMMSHGVDLDRLNIMTVLGMPLTTAEFIQTTARVGRTYPGLVYVVLKVGRERDASTFAHFAPFIEQGDRFVEPIPVTRTSRRVLELTLPAAIEARRLFVHEPASPGERLTMVDHLRRYFAMGAISPKAETDACAGALGLPPDAHLARDDVDAQLEVYFARLSNPGYGAKWPNQLLTRQPMRSLRDVETSVPITDD